MAKVKTEKLRRVTVFMMREDLRRLDRMAVLRDSDGRRFTRLVARSAAVSRAICIAATEDWKAEQARVLRAMARGLEQR